MQRPLLPPNCFLVYRILNQSYCGNGSLIGLPTRGLPNSRTKNISGNFPGCYLYFLIFSWDALCIFLYFPKIFWYVFWYAPVYWFNTQKKSDMKQGSADNVSIWLLWSLFSGWMVRCARSAGLGIGIQFFQTNSRAGWAGWASWAGWAGWPVDRVC